MPLSYSVPWDLVISLTGDIAHRRRHAVNEFAEAVVARMPRPPRIVGMERLPADARFLLVANHYQRRGLWILHTAATVMRGVLERYGAGGPPAVRWLATANWPPLQIGPWRFPSPGDRLLSRVAYALYCYPVPFAGKDPAATARSLRTVLRDARLVTRPIGLFPEGVTGIAGQLAPPLPGSERLIAQLARGGMPCVPAGVSEDGERLIVRFGTAIAPADLITAPDAARLAMERVAELIRQG